jgi:PPOX class probable F420-dependent enzyme
MSTQRERFAEARVAHLATVRPDGAPHLVPIVFALEDDRVYTAIDDKPKRTRELQRLANIAADPRVSVLVDSYY